MATQGVEHSLCLASYSEWTAVSSKKYPLSLLMYQGIFHVTDMMKFGVLPGSDDHWSLGSVSCFVQGIFLAANTGGFCFGESVLTGDIFIEASFDQIEKLTILSVSQ